jgi:hypothetical protein
MARPSSAPRAVAEVTVADAHAVAVAALASVGDVQGERIKDLEIRKRELRAEQKRVAKTQKSEKEKRKRLLAHVNKCSTADLLGVVAGRVTAGSQPKERARRRAAREEEIAPFSDAHVAEVTADVDVGATDVEEDRAAVLSDAEEPAATADVEVGSSVGDDRGSMFA